MMRRLALYGLRLAFRAMPRRQRDRFGMEMLAAFEDQWDAAGERPLAGCALFARAFADVIRTGAAMRLERRARGRASNALPLAWVSPGSWLQDFSYAFRLLRRNPGFAAAAVVTLAVGIGANAAVFSLVNALLFRAPPAVADPARLVALFTDEGGSLGVSSYLDVRDIEERVGSFDAVAAYKSLSMDFGRGDETVRASGLLVTGDYFQTLGVHAALGRLLGPEDDVEPGAHSVAVLSWGAWQREFAADPDALGREVQLNGRPFTIVGVTPRGFEGTTLDSAPAELFAPMMMQAHFMPSSGYLLDRRGWSGVLAVARLRVQVDVATAQAEVERVGEWVRQTYPGFAEGRSYRLVPLSEAGISPSMRGPISQVSGLLLAVTGIVLLVACVNVANLLLARSAARRREIAVRQALGAGRGRVARQLLIETTLLALCGGAAGLVLANMALESFDLLPIALPEGVGLHPRVLLFTAAVSLVAGLSFGVIPAIRATRSDPARRLRDTGDLRGGGGRRPAANVLVVAQVALSMVLTVAAGLFARTLVELRSVDPGFNPVGVALMGVDPGLQGYDRSETRVLYDDLLERVRSLPGVASASLASLLPGPAAGDVMTLYVEGTPADERMRFGFTIVDPDYLRTLGVSIASGRDFERADGTSSTLVAVVNDAARRALEESLSLDALATRLGPEGPEGPMAEIVGVTVPTKTGALRADPEPMIYLLFPQLVGQGFGTRMTVVARTAGDPAALAGMLREQLREVAPGVPSFGVGTLEAHVAGSLAQDRSIALMIGVSALLSLALSLVGLYGVLSYTVSRRSSEMGIRMALGASVGDVRGLVIRQGVGLAAVGIVVGGLATVAAARLLEAFLFGVSGTDPLVYLAMAIVLLVVATASAWLPARNATRVDPAMSLRAS